MCLFIFFSLFLFLRGIYQSKVQPLVVHDLHIDTYIYQSIVQPLVVHEPLGLLLFLLTLFLFFFCGGQNVYESGLYSRLYCIVYER